MARDTIAILDCNNFNCLGSGGFYNGFGGEAGMCRHDAHVLAPKRAEGVLQMQKKFLH